MGSKSQSYMDLNCWLQLGLMPQVLGGTGYCGESWGLVLYPGAGVSAPTLDPGHRTLPKPKQTLCVS